MLTIRVEQMAALQRASERTFIDRLSAHVVLRWGVMAGGAARESWISEAVRRARGYRLKSEKDITEFVDLTFEFGREFDLEARHATGAAILRGRQLAAARMRQLRDWAAAVRGSAGKEA
ncbi:hypothetical protein [Comamonas sp. JC664]|uniref:hypothetical protein n=1 Tax=Comamonas sp. JC664 TaxID=2801917 RepID=UPI00174BF1BA|nr:hypothetical protein [Comamonas sp. JC664]MBL0697196.1 hypothetical protein [Comamonas sp. JC664]GHG83053.1 hypothetical protein GCM10012319_37680 [Comamonas sp. KCTC 72670]